VENEEGNRNVDFDQTSIWSVVKPFVKSRAGRINSKRPPGASASIPTPCVTLIKLNMAMMLPTKMTG
jgi:hypothetical protein